MACFLTHRIIWLDVIKEVFHNADEWSSSNSQANQQEDIILLVVLSRGSIRSFDDDPWKSATGEKSFQNMML